MSIENAILALAAAIEKLAAGGALTASANTAVPAPAAPEPASEPAKAPGKSAAQKAVADALAAAEAAKVEAEMAKKDQEADAALDYDKDVAPALQGYLKKNGREAGVALMAKFGAKKGGEIKAKDYAAVLAEIAADDLA